MGQTWQTVIGASAPASTAPENGRSKVVFSCHENSPLEVSATTSNNLALRGDPIRFAPRNGRKPKRPPLPVVAADLGFKVSATFVYDRPCAGVGRGGHTLN